MQLISHRTNKIEDLKKLDKKYGVEIDIRDNGKKLIVVHDPFKKGIDLDTYLKNYNHKILIANIKSERIEDTVIKKFKRKKIKNFFFLDSSFPKIIDLINKKVSNIGLRVSYYEDISTAKKLKNKVKWIWYDTFFGLPKNTKDFKYLKKLNYKICLVCPKLHNIKLDTKSKIFIKIKKSNLIDAVCTKEKYFNLWS
jgi:hypothetical protein